MESFDLVVIGAGPGGYPAAIRGAQLGAKVAIAERELLGGTCLHWGCIPTKTMIAAAGLLSELRQAAGLGLHADKLAMDFGGLQAHKKRVVGQLHDGVRQLLKANGVTVYSGTASFSGRNRLRIADAAGVTTEIGAGRTIIATGSASVMPGFLPKSPRIMDSRGFLDLASLPANLLVMGGGYIGCELACLAAQLGSRVTIVELLDDVLLNLDPDIRREVRRHMESVLGMKILTGQPMRDVQAGPSGVSGKVGDATLAGEALLVSVGRRPVTDGLALDRAGLSATEKGTIPTDDFGRTPAATVYAIGDVTGRIQLAHAATAQGIVAAENALTRTLRRNDPLVPAVVFTTPEAAYAGISEPEAKEKGLAVKIGRFHYRALGRALAAGHPDGFVKWIADAATDRLLGAAAVGAHATDLIGEATLAIRHELTAEELGRTIHAHPTFAELWMEAAHAVHGQAIHAAPVRKKG